VRKRPPFFLPCGKEPDNFTSRKLTGVPFIPELVRAYEFLARKSWVKGSTHWSRRQWLVGYKLSDFHCANGHPAYLKKREQIELNPPR
jgi:hypothetical protein